MKFLSRKSKEEKDEDATKKCSDCMAEIPLKAKKCQRCGTKQKQEASVMGILLMVGVVVFIFVWLFSLLGGDGGGGGSTPKPQIDGQKAFIISQSYVKAALKAPSSADFPTFDYTAFDRGSGTWKVISYVDAQNSFGAQIRTDWGVLLTHTGGDWANNSNWELEELVLGDKVVYP